MIELITFTLNGILLIVLGFILSDIISFIYNCYIYYDRIEPGDLYSFFELPNKKIRVIIIEKSKGYILFQHIDSSGAKGALNKSFAPSFYLSSIICNE